MILLEIPSITDWIQSIGAVIAAIGLVWTLVLQSKATRFQAEATQQQVEALKLQKHEFLLSIFPKFEIVKTDSSNNNLFGTLCIKCLNNQALIRTVVNESDSRITIKGYKQEIVINTEITEGHSISFTYSCNVEEISFLERIALAEKLSVSMIIYFDNSIGNKYSQVFEGKLADKQFYLYPAKLIL